MVWSGLGSSTVTCIHLPSSNMASPSVPALPLGSSGLRMPVLGLGTLHSGKPESGRLTYDAVKVAIETGYRHIDCAWVYKNEDEVGDAIREKIKEGKVTREDLFIVTKLFNFSHAPDKVEPAIRESLAALQLDYVDLYLIHWPMAWQTSGEESKWTIGMEAHPADPYVDFVDTWRAMERLVEQGLARSVGVSNFNQEQLTRILSAPGLKLKPANNQFEIHPYLANRALVDFCHKNGISVTAYSPIAKPGTEYAGDVNLLADAVLKRIGDKYKKTSAQVSLRWGIQRGYAVIPKSVTPARIKENFNIFDFALTEEDMRDIDALDTNTRIVHLSFLKGQPDFPF